MAAQFEHAHIHSGIPILTKIFNTHFRRRKNGIILLCTGAAAQASSQFWGWEALETLNRQSSVSWRMARHLPFRFACRSRVKLLLSFSPPEFPSFYHIPVNTTVVLRLQTLCHLFLLGLDWVCCVFYFLSFFPSVFAPLFLCSLIVPSFNVMQCKVDL